MISKNKIELLSEDELSLLLYCLNEFKSGETEINVPELSLIRPKFAFLALNEQASKIKPEHIGLLQSIADKITKD